MGRVIVQLLSQPLAISGYGMFFLIFEVKEMCFGELICLKSYS